MAASRSNREPTPEIRERAKKALAEEKKNLAATKAQAKEMKRAAEECRELFAMLKAAREKQGLTLAEVSDRTGISRGSLSRMENGLGPNPTWATLTRIASALGMRLDVKLKKTA